MSDLSETEQVEIMRGVFNFPYPCKARSATWKKIQELIQGQIHQNQITQKRKSNSALRRWQKKRGEPTDSLLESVVESDFAAMTENDELKNTLTNPNSALSVFLATGEGYDELSIPEQQFVDQGKIRNKCKWHLNITYQPKLETWMAFWKAKGYPEKQGKALYDSYAVAGWCDSNGKPILNWKQKILQVWGMRNEQKKGNNFERGEIPL